MDDILIMRMSLLTPGTTVTFPKHQGERVYMLPFRQRDKLPEHLRHWQDTVDAMLDGVEAPGDIFLMIDQACVPKGTFHRRPGPHIDGYWVGSGHGHSPRMGHGPGITHGPAPKPRKRTKADDEPLVSPGWRCNSPGWNGSSALRNQESMDGSWTMATFDEPEAIILASNIAACRAYVSHSWGLRNNSPNPIRRL
jgi:hypothetical protein